MQSLLLLPLLVFGLGAVGPFYAEIYSGYGQTGDFANLSMYFSDDLSEYGMDDDIESVRQTGMWLYYEDYKYNWNETGSMYYVHGIDIAATFPAEYRNIMSSLRCGLCFKRLNPDYIALFSGKAFAGFEFMFGDDGPINTEMNVSSILMTGPSPWTVYTGKTGTGESWCLYNTDHDVGSDGATLDLGIYPYLEDVGIPDNSIHSTRKGCHAARVAKAPKLQVDGRQENGAWGRLV